MSMWKMKTKCCPFFGFAGVLVVGGGVCMAILFIGSCIQLPAKNAASPFQLEVLLHNCHLHAALDDAVGDGIAGESGGVVDVKFLHEILAVFFHGLDADM